MKYFKGCMGKYILMQTMLYYIKVSTTLKIEIPRQLSVSEPTKSTFKISENRIMEYKENSVYSLR
jgi:hypothetical protein